MSDKPDTKENGLVTVGDKALTTGSSALVKRGLEALASPQPSSAGSSSERSWKEMGKAVLNGLDWPVGLVPHGVDIQFEDRSDKSELGRVVESTVWVNRSHPAYRRALASRSIGYHIALAVAMALAPLAVESADKDKFIMAFLSRWGAKRGSTT